MKVDVLTKVQETLQGRQVFGDPIERDGVVVIPAASVAGGGGGGSGADEDGQEGEGGGFGLTARPTGAYVIRGGDVRWQPALDVNRAVTAAACVGTVWLLTHWRIARIRSRRSA